MHLKTLRQDLPGLAAKVLLSFAKWLRNARVSVCDNLYTSYTIAELLQRMGCGLPLVWVMLVLWTSS